MDNLAKSNDGAPFPETADIHTSSDGYAGRFAGKSGAWMLQVQEETTLRFLRPFGAKTVLDVGGGHGQLAHPLARDGYDVTVLGSAPECSHRIQSLVDAQRCRFVVGNVIALPFPDRSFDAVVCIRLVMHCDAWPTLIAELCRVARKAVIIDYPTSQSVNSIAPALFGAKKKFEKNTRQWRLFRHDELLPEFAKHGFKQQDRTGQFFFPMVVHRALKAQPLSAALEGTSRALGLNRRWGSPVILSLTR